MLSLDLMLNLFVLGLLEISLVWLDARSSFQ
jgi:hypothetical protein